MDRSLKTGQNGIERDEKTETRLYLITVHDVQVERIRKCEENDAMQRM